MLSRNLSLYLIAIMEGGALLSFEIMASRIYTPHLGSTTYVWTSILATTLIALALSYRYSHRLIVKKSWKVVPIALTIAGSYVLFSTYGSSFLLESTYKMSIKSASLLIGILLIFVPVFCLGLISPMLASLLAAEPSDLGKQTGLVYGLSTISGVIFTLICVFYLMPNIGVQSTLLCISLLLFSASVISYFKIQRNEF